jgi:hypothetical protein
MVDRIRHTSSVQLSPRDKKGILWDRLDALNSLSKCLNACSVFGTDHYGINARICLDDPNRWKGGTVISGYAYRFIHVSATCKDDPSLISRQLQRLHCWRRCQRLP